MTVFRAAAKLATGNGLAQAITLASYALLGRLYSPADFGLLGVIAGIGTIGGTAASLRYDFTVLLPRRRSLADLAVYTSLLVALATTLVVTVVIFACATFGQGEWTRYWWLIGPMTIALAIINVLSFVQNRERRYAGISGVQIVRALAMLALSVAFVGNGAGLVYGHLGGAIAGALTAIWLCRRADGYAFRTARWQRVRAWLRRQRKFPKYSFPAVFVSAFSTQLPVFMISGLLGASAAGHFSIIQRTVSGPTQVISRAINKVYLQRIARMRADRVPIFSFQRSITAKTVVATLAVSGVFAVFCLLGGYRLVFGPQWEGLDRLALILLPVMLVGFVAKCVASFAVLDRNELGLVYQVVLVVATFFAIYVPYHLGLGFTWTLAAYSAAVTAAYFGQVVSVHTIAYQEDVRRHGRIS